MFSGATGVELRFGNGASPEVFTAVGQLADLPTSPQPTRARIDTSTHNAAAGASGTDDFILGFRRGGNFSAKVFFDPTLHGNSSGKLKAIFDAGLKLNCQIAFPTSPTATLTFLSAVSKFGPSHGLDAALFGEVTVEYVGATTLA